MDQAKRQTITRDELYARVWAEPTTKVAAAYGVSGTGLAKICSKMEVPVPPRGYWQRKAVGTAPEQTPLPTPKPSTPTEHTIIPPPPKAPPIERAAETIEALEGEKARPRITVPEEIESFHSLVQRARKLLRNRQHDDATPWREHACLDMNVGPEMLDRASRVFHVLLAELAARGLRVDITEPKRARDPYDSEWSRTIVHVLGEHVGISIHENVISVKIEKPPVIPPGRRRKPLPPALRYLDQPTYTWERRHEGKLRIQLRGPDGKVRMSWVDHLDRNVEDCLNDVMRQLFYVADDLRRERERQERWNREREEESRRAYELAVRQRRHDALVSDAEKRIANIQFARDLRALADEVESKLRATSELDAASDSGQWLVWARDLADRVEQQALTTVHLAWRPPSPW